MISHDLAVVLSVLKRDPWLPVGLGLVGVAAVAGHRMYGTVRDTEFRSLNMHRYIVEYQRLRKEKNWPAWPIYVYWSTIIVGIAAFAIGVIGL